MNRQIWLASKTTLRSQQLEKFEENKVKEEICQKYELTKIVF